MEQRLDPEYFVEAQRDLFFDKDGKPNELHAMFFSDDLEKQDRALRVVNDRARELQQKAVSKPQSGQSRRRKSKKTRKTRGRRQH